MRAVSPMARAMAVAALHVLLISSLGAKLLYDRNTCPQAWFKTRQYDPNLPIRGRYLSLQLELRAPRPPRLESGPSGRECGSIVVRDGQPFAIFNDPDSSPWQCENLSFEGQTTAGGATTVLLANEPVLFFVPDTAQLPTPTRDGTELWVLATVPRTGPPRPIALGVKKAGESEIRRLGFN